MPRTCRDDDQFNRSIRAHAMYLLKHDYPCSSAATMFEYKLLKFHEDRDEPELLRVSLECVSKMSDACVATFVTDRLKRVLAREVVTVPVCEVCKDSHLYQALRAEFDDVMPRTEPDGYDVGWKEKP